MTRSTPFAAVCALVLAALPAAAHSPGLSILRIIQAGPNVRFELQFSPFDTDGDGRASAEELADAERELRALGDRWMKLARNGRPLALPRGTVVASPEDEAVYWRTSLPLEPAGRWRLVLERLGDLPPGHRELVLVEAADGATVAEALLTERSPALEFEWP